MFAFIEKIFPFLRKELKSIQMDEIRKLVEAELKTVPKNAGSVTISIKIDPKISEDLANIYLEKLAQEYGKTMKKKLVLIARK